MRKFQGPAGSVSRIEIESQSLKGNLLGDPTRRPVDVYIPAGHSGRDLPLLVDLVGFTASGLAHTNWAGFQENGRLKLAARPRAITSRLQALISFCCAAVPTVAEKLASSSTATR